MYYLYAKKTFYYLISKIFKRNDNEKKFNYSDSFNICTLKL